MPLTLCQTCANPCKYGYHYDCPNYKSKDVGKQTNEEWFCLLSTKEKAKTIICLAVNSMYKQRKGLVDSDIGEIIRWLKEKHDEM